MITKDQIFELSKKYKIDQTTIFREYFQLLFLSELYSQKESKNIFFKGGTCLHLVFKSPRFSEDLDFSVLMPKEKFSKFLNKVFNLISKKEKIALKTRKTLTGERFLLIGQSDIFPYRAFVSLDFSFREKILRPQKSIIETEFPIVFTSFVWHLSKEEIFAEKIRAIMTRVKGRDLYDLWYLVNLGAKLEKGLVKEKLRYYKLEKTKKEEILKRINKFPLKDFILDVRPFISEKEREKLSHFFTYLKEYLKQRI